MRKVNQLLAGITAWLCCAQGVMFSAYAQDISDTTEPLADMKVTISAGDVDLSGTLDIRDVILVNRAILGKSTLSETQKAAADFNHDGDVLPADALDIMKKIVGIIQDEPEEQTLLACEKERTYPSSEPGGYSTEYSSYEITDKQLTTNPDILTQLEKVNAKANQLKSAQMIKWEFGGIEDYGEDYLYLPYTDENGNEDKILLCEFGGNCAWLDDADVQTLVTLLIENDYFGDDSLFDMFKAVTLSEAVKSQEVSGKELDETFVKAQTEFYLNLFKKAEQETPEENILVSPYSAMQALAMTANGANGSTKTGMENALGGLPLDELNQYLYTQRTNAPNDEKCKLNTANSIWFRDDSSRMTVFPEFLQKNADYYGADAFSAPFDDSTVSDINDWCKDKTEGMIPQLLQTIPNDAVMYLINAVAFDGKWEDAYTEFAVHDGIFTAADGTEQTAEMMYSDTEYEYLSDEHAEGFYKPYAGGKYAFAALLPEESMTVEEYLSGLTAESLQNTLANPKSAGMVTYIPKFTYDYEIELSPALAEMGMEEAFNPKKADFSNMAETASGMLCISKVQHKTHIEVNESGTNAAAVTSVEMRNCTASMPEHIIELNRPFVYMIVDRETCLPVFMGILNELN